jgi:hypothetical protein
MMQKLVFIFLFFCWCACSPPKKPKDVLTQEQLCALLVDVYTAEARLDPMPITKDSAIHFFIPYEQKLLQAKGIPDSILKKTYSYYLAHPKEFEQVYDAVIDTLTLHEKQAEHGPPPGKRPPFKKLQ